MRSVSTQRAELPAGTPEPSTYHWFIGDGMVHGLRLREGRALWYRNRWVRSPEVARTLGETPKPGLVHGGMDFAPNTNVIGHAGRTFAIVESGSLPYELTDELDTVRGVRASTERCPAATRPTLKRGPRER